MKIKLLILISIGIIVTLGFTGIAFAESIPIPEPPTLSDEQEQMIREYCETGIRHPDMLGIPQCIKNEPGCGPGPMFVDGICIVEAIQVDSIGSDGSPLPFVGGLVLVFGIIGLVVYLVKKRDEN